MKLTFQKAVTSYHQIMQHIETDSEWAWAKPQEITNEIKGAKHDLDNSMGEFGRNFMAQDVSALRKTHNAAELGNLCNKLVLDLTKKVDELHDHCTVLLNMQNARGSKKKYCLLLSLLRNLGRRAIRCVLEPQMLKREAEGK